MTRDPYTPPQSEVGAPGGTQVETRSFRFPWALVLAWLVGGAISLQALFVLFNVGIKWQQLADLAVIDSSLHPWPLIPVGLAKLATGVLLIQRRSWLFVPMTIWFGGFIYMMFVRTKADPVSGPVALAVAELLAILGFCVALALLRRLR